MSRTKKSIRNVIFTIVGFVVTTLLQLVNRKVFILFLSSEYLGLNGLFSNILSMLSLSEMGIGAAIVVALYKPIAEKNTEKVKSLMALYKKLYTIIGTFVLIAGALLTPFLHLLIKEMPDIPYIHIYYLMFVIDSGLSYFYTYKRSLIICNQDNYISTTTTMLSSVGTKVVQLIILLLTHNYFLFLLVQILFTRLENVLISKIADKQYPFLKDKQYQKLSKDEIRTIRNNVFAMLAHKIGMVIVNATDNLIISKILGLAVLGVYSNYVLLTQTIESFVTKIFSSITASIGNLVAEQSKEEVETVYIGVDEKKFTPEKYDKECLKQKYLGVEKNKKIISYVCRISEQKRPMLFLQIIASLKEKRQDFKVIVVGDGNLLDKMKDTAKKLQIYDNMIFMGNMQNTTEIYAISDVTVNCSIKEGLALTSYESLSMEVPVVSADVGGQKELINEKVGKIVKLRQNEKNLYDENYSKEEIQDYVEAINNVLDNLEMYKKNCRNRIIEYFTIDKMINKMSDILQNTAKKPSENKIENGIKLKENINLCRELITLNVKNDEVEYKWECTEYEKRIYGQAYSIQNMNYKKEILKEILWKNPAWRGFVKIVHKLRR